VIEDSIKNLQESIYINLCRQLNSFWHTPEEECLLLLKKNYLCVAMEKTINCINATKSKYRNSQGIDYLNTVQYSILLYYLSNAVGNGGDRAFADKLYYLNKVMHSVDWYWEIQLPACFWAEHPVGSVLGRAKYSDYLMIYQGCTIGGNNFKYPVLEEFVILYAKVTLLGNSHIGNKVVISANTYIKDQDIPDCSIVF